MTFNIIITIGAIVGAWWCGIAPSDVEQYSIGTRILLLAFGAVIGVIGSAGVYGLSTGFSPGGED